MLFVFLRPKEFFLFYVGHPEFSLKLCLLGRYGFLKLKKVLLTDSFILCM